MATITVYPHLSPRVIEVDSPTTNISVQELVNLVRAWEDKVIGMHFPFLIDAAGKEDLGGGVFVGITTTLQNAVIAFAIQGGVDSSGTVTTADTTGLVLIDSAGTFISDGILAGDTVLNVTDQSITSIISVDSETQVTTFLLQSGSDNQFQIGDSYKIWNKVQCEVSGGNLVAVDESGVTMSPFLPTAQTHVLRSSSSSATLQGAQEIANIKFLIEALRPHHSGQGKIIYWNPDTGDDLFTGESQATAIATFSRAHALAGDGTHDTIMCLSGIQGQTQVDETLTITKNYLFVRGPGRDFRIKPTSTTAPTISIDAVGVEVKGIVVDTASSGGQNAIQVEDGADFFHIDSVWSRDAQHSAVKIIGSNVYGRINDCFFSHTVDSAIHIDGNVRHVKITNTEIDEAGVSGITIEGTTARNNIIDTGVKIYNSVEYGIRINAPATRNFISSDVALYSNALGNLLDNGTDTEFERIANTVWDEAVAGHVTAGTTGKALSDAGGAGNPWGSPVTGNTDPGTFGELVGKKLLTVAKFLGLK